MKKRLFYISQLADPNIVDTSMFDTCLGGGRELEWIKYQLEALNLMDVVDFRGASVERGETLPEFDEVDLVMVGGSFHSVSDNFPWQQNLQAWLKSYRKTEKPLFGICGGHQQMATSMGATVGKIETGPMAASLPIDLTEDGQGHFLFDGFDQHELVFHFGNYEHVEFAPSDAKVIAKRPEMPAMGIDYGGNWYSVQYHPEAIRDVFANSWRNSHPEFCDNYVELPKAPLMLKNFITKYAL